MRWMWSFIATVLLVASAFGQTIVHQRGSVYLPDRFDELSPYRDFLTIEPRFDKTTITLITQPSERGIKEGALQLARSYGAATVFEKADDDYVSYSFVAAKSTQTSFLHSRTSMPLTPVRRFLKAQLKSGDWYASVKATPDNSVYTKSYVNTFRSDLSEFGPELKVDSHRSGEGLFGVCSFFVAPFVLVILALRGAALGKGLKGPYQFDPSNVRGSIIRAYAIGAADGTLIVLAMTSMTSDSYTFDASAALQWLDHPRFLHLFLIGGLCAAGAVVVWRNVVRCWGNGIAFGLGIGAIFLLLFYCVASPSTQILDLIFDNEAFGLQMFLFAIVTCTLMPFYSRILTTGTRKMEAQHFQNLKTLEPLPEPHISKQWIAEHIQSDLNRPSPPILWVSTGPLAEYDRRLHGLGLRRQLIDRFTNPEILCLIAQTYRLYDPKPGEGLRIDFIQFLSFVRYFLGFFFLVPIASSLLLSYNYLAATIVPWVYMYFWFISSSVTLAGDAIAYKFGQEPYFGMLAKQYVLGPVVFIGHPLHKGPFISKAGLVRFLAANRRRLKSAGFEPDDAAFASAVLAVEKYFDKDGLLQDVPQMAQTPTPVAAAI